METSRNMRREIKLFTRNREEWRLDSEYMSVQE